MQIDTNRATPDSLPVSTMARPGAFIIDNDRTERTHLTALLAECECTAHFFDDAATFDAQVQLFAQDAQPACLIVDTEWADGIGLHAWIGAHRELPIIFTAKKACVRTAVRAMKAGGFEFLAKPFDAQLLRDVVRQALQQSRAALAQQVEMKQLHDRFDLLSQREREVMRLVVAGRLNKQAADELGIAEITVKTHRGKVMRKMRAASLPDLVIMAATLRDKAAGIDDMRLDISPRAAWNA